MIFTHTPHLPLALEASRPRAWLLYEPRPFTEMGGASRDTLMNMWMSSLADLTPPFVYAHAYFLILLGSIAQFLPYQCLCAHAKVNSAAVLVVHRCLDTLIATWTSFEASYILLRFSGTALHILGEVVEYLIYRYRLTAHVRTVLIKVIRIPVQISRAMEQNILHCVKQQTDRDD